jgi:cytochrome c peroxidase
MSCRGLPASGPTDGHADGAALNACHSHPDHASGRTDRATPRSRGHGEVYRAADTRLDRTVAIKLLPDHIASDAELRERFEREGAFKTPTLREKALTALYMHNGSIGSLDEVSP